MNKWNQLLQNMDAVFGFENKVKSTFRKVKQEFDGNANEHVITIEYRVMKGDPSVSKKKHLQDQRKIQRGKKLKLGNLLKAMTSP